MMLPWQSVCSKRTVPRRAPISHGQALVRWSACTGGRWNWSRSQSVRVRDCCVGTYGLRGGCVGGVVVGGGGDDDGGRAQVWVFLTCAVHSQSSPLPAHLLFVLPSSPSTPALHPSPFAMPTHSLYSFYLLVPEK